VGQKEDLKVEGLDNAINKLKLKSALKNGMWTSIVGWGVLSEGNPSFVS
jgi:hypothetical protein